MDERQRAPSPKALIDRRRFLEFLGAGASVLAAGSSLGSLWGCVPRPTTTAAGGWTDADGKPRWTPPAYPVPLPGDPEPVARDAERFADYEVHDDLIVPKGWRFDVVVEAGERLGPADDPARQIDFGYNNDYTGLLPIDGSPDEFWLMVNHEYLALRPWLASEVEDGRTVPAMVLTADRRDPIVHKYGILTLDGFSFDRMSGSGFDLAAAQAAEVPDSIRETIRDLSDRGLAIQGVSILRVRREANARFSVVRDAPDHRRIATQTTQNIPLDADDAPPFAFTGPAASYLDRPRGTFCNCSGGTSPWGTFFTCEENYHYQIHEPIAPDGTSLDGRSSWRVSPVRINGVVIDDVPEPWTINGMGYAASEVLDGRQYGWVCEIDPETGGLKKHTSLGRFRHENVTTRVDAGKALAAYMGDDRRGGHVWKFVSDAAVADPKQSATSRLLERGTLYVARFEAGFTGRWIPLVPETPLRRPEPEHVPTRHIRAPLRPGGGFIDVGDRARGEAEIEVDEWIASIESFTGKPFADCTLGDLVRPAAPGGEDDRREQALGILLMDAFAMANAIGGTPTARPEDLEVHPIDKSVYIAFTDADRTSEGSPDERIFPDSRYDTSRQYGAVYRLVEDGDDPATTSFTWGKLVAAGEVVDGGGGFANADNLFFDPAANLWMVTDISTTVQNFPTRRDATDGTQPGGKQFPGVFGNNAMFMLPTRGPEQGVPYLFAIGPMESELTGPTFSPDGRSLLVSVQHPGEESGTRQALAPSEVQEHIVVGRDGKPFTQRRVVPVGSNFPSGRFGKAPRPAVVCITRDPGED